MAEKVADIRGWIKPSKKPIELHEPVETFGEEQENIENSDSEENFTDKLNSSLTKSRVAPSKNITTVKVMQFQKS